MTQKAFCYQVWDFFSAFDKLFSHWHIFQMCNRGLWMLPIWILVTITLSQPPSCYRPKPLCCEPKTKSCRKTQKQWAEKGSYYVIHYDTNLGENKVKSMDVQIWTNMYITIILWSHLKQIKLIISGARFKVKCTAGKISVSITANSDLQCMLSLLCSLCILN